MVNLVGLLKTALKQSGSVSRAGTIKHSVGGLRMLFTKTLSKTEIKALGKKIPEFMAKEFETFDKVYKPVLLKDGRMRILTKQDGIFHRYLFAPDKKTGLLKETIIGKNSITTQIFKGPTDEFVNVARARVRSIKDGRLLQAFSDGNTVTRSFLNGSSETQKVTDRICYVLNGSQQCSNGYHEVIVKGLFNDKGVVSHPKTIISGFFSFNKPKTLTEIARACESNAVSQGAKYSQIIPPYRLTNYRQDVLRV